MIYYNEKIDRCGVAAGRQFLAARQWAEVRKCLEDSLGSPGRRRTVTEEKAIEIENKV